MRKKLTTLKLALGLTLLCSLLPLARGGASLAFEPVKIAGIDSGAVVRLSEEKDGRRIFHVGRMVINASPEDVFGVLTDYDRAGKLFTNLKDCKVTSKEDNVKNVFFSVRGIANIWNFDYALAVKETFPRLIEWHRISGAFKANEGYWKLEPMEQGRKTMVTYAKFVDGGLIPQALVNRQLKETIPEIMTNLKRLSEGRSNQVPSGRTT